VSLVLIERLVKAITVDDWVGVFILEELVFIVLLPSCNENFRAFLELRKVLLV